MMLQKEHLDEMRGIIRTMQKSGEGENVHVAEWLRILLDELEVDQDLLFLLSSLEELRKSTDRLMEQIELLRYDGSPFDLSDDKGHIGRVMQGN